ncbi:MAG TPA: cytochrome c3 family protein [Candidatus Limnocylindrales bacterium]|nr:cytochrome c3 family protein [Candidatus Limnocylindrales bacterium]
MTAALRRHWFALAVITLLALISGTGAFLVTLAGDDLAAIAMGPEPTPESSPEATPPSQMALSPIGIAIPEGSDCEGCHTTTGGIGTKPIPVMAHPLWGWRDCTACHLSGALVESAPGHSGLHKDQCLVCHQTQTDVGVTPAPLRPEHMGTDKPCIACHGVDEHAPLPENMANRGNNCWICHNGPEFTYLFEEDASAPPESGGQGEGSPVPDASTVPDASADPASVSYRLDTSPGD